ncbi:hypothetical protein AtNW77_Chr4g0310631 [Arabidopsis thaliana]|uniref:Uncharacterized protein n=2 Tax=Arabidopsis TaxID=3701 RepID=A0A178V366_ARATH|nr:hypothetical protein ISN45_At04g033960 [Arabidopsis thaliana x Arabidopsis arenosa]OAP00689.1 hypothetical protein AXX17_AT4G36700 [Arabidopsis thaliana]
MKKVTSSKIPAKDDWVAVAITDDDLVVELLLRLKHAGTVVSDNPAVILPPLRWGIRQRRSRSSRFGGGGGVLVSLKKDVDSVRASPKTPLSWSGGSGSGGGSASPSADGFEDTSRQASCSTSTGSGSKVFPTNEITSCFSKRLKKRKSSFELKNEENLKLKERLDLEKEIASLRATFDEQNLRNQKLKRIKLDLNSGRVTNKKPVDLIRKSQLERLQGSKSCKTSDSQNQGSFFVLPDLNMAPSEEEILYGTS